MTAGEIAGLVAAIAGLTGLVTFFVNRYDKNKDPLPKQTAEAALAEKMLGLVEASATRLNADVVRLEKRIDEQAAKITRLEEQGELDGRTIEDQQVKIEDQQTKIAGLERRVTGMIDDRDALVAYVVTFRQWVAGGSRPPAPEPPRHLADVLPAWESGDGVESPDTPTD